MHISTLTFPFQLLLVVGLLVSNSAINLSLLVPCVECSSSTPFVYPDCVSGFLSSHPICNESLSPDVRVLSLISLMTLPEKITRLGSTSPAIDRISLPAYEWWSEALHGLADSPGVIWSTTLPYNVSTSFPCPIGLAASFHTELIHDIAGVISDEARAYSNVGRAGVDLWTPFINPARDPRWGRMQEIPGEDPYLMQRYTYAHVKGLQESDVDPLHVKIIANCKVLVAYDLDDWGGVTRHTFNAVVSDIDLFSYHLPMHETCVKEAGALSMMCGYPEVNGIPACAHPYFETSIARDTYGLKGWITSDCGAINDIYETHHYTTTPEAAVAQAIRAGTDIDCAGGYFQKYAGAAIQQGLLNESHVDLALYHQFITLIYTGFFDPPDKQPYRFYGPNQINTLYAQKLARQAAVESFVLLKNINQTLPIILPSDSGSPGNSTISSGTKQKLLIALIGPNAAATSTLQGNYHGQAPYLISVLSAMMEAASSTNAFTVVYHQGCDINSNDTSGFAVATASAATADYVVMVMGLNDAIEAEANDRNEIIYPGVQLELIQAVAKVSVRPIIVLVMGGGQLDSTLMRDSPLCGALMWLGYSGQEGGHAVVDVLFGSVSPSGRLPVTQYPAHYVQEVAFTDMNLRPSANSTGRTYMFYTGDPIYAFGTGLSYTTFDYEFVLTQKPDKPLQPVYHLQQLLSSYTASSSSGASATTTPVHQLPLIDLSINVTNTGTLTSSVSVLLFIVAANQSSSSGLLPPVAPPLKQLINFTFVSLLAAGESRIVSFTIPLQSISVTTKQGQVWAWPGLYHLYINERLIQTTFMVEGEPVLLRQWPRPNSDMKTRQQHILLE